MARSSDANAAMSAMGRAGATGEKEVTQKKYDEAAVAEKFKKLNEELAAKRDAAAKKEAKLAAVAVNAGDVTLVAEQLGLPAAEAKRKLQAHNGDAAKLFKAVVEGTA
uniref:Nascent polypeptide-associated complex subunit alpha-like UBA domain-containing protein n=1 Tax=Neobodo designis TaxID=312471 RepID=A0A7S1KXT9_NEODS